MYFGILFEKKVENFEYKIRYKALEGGLRLMHFPLDSLLDPER